MRKIVIKEDGLSSIKKPTVGEYVLGFTGSTFGVMDSDGNIREIGGTSSLIGATGPDGQIGATGSSGTIFSGILNYISKFTPDGNTLGTSSIFDDGTSVGIGTINPGSTLHVVNPSSIFTAKFESPSDSRLLVRSSSSSDAQVTVLSESGIGSVNIYSYNSTTPSPSGGSTINFYKYGNTGLIVPGRIYYDISNTKFNIESGDGYSLSLNVGYTEKLNIDTSGVVTINGLTGSGTRMLTVNSSGSLIASTSSIVQATGTINYISKFIGTNTLGNSLIFDNGTNIGIGTPTPNTNAILDIMSTTKAFIPPRMTTIQKNAITPTAGMVVYDITLNKLCVYTTTWETITSA